MNYGETIEVLTKIRKQRGSVPGLEGVRELAHLLGDPQDHIDTVHIAGTNGKGSVGAEIAAALKEAGYRVGRFSSPAVFDYLEQFQINGENLAEEKYASVMTEVEACCRQMVKDGFPHPTAFEMETVAAWMAFLREQCDCAVIESGMGGTLDATNIVRRPLVSVITSVSLDHMGVLGDSLEEIAANKAGIIKPGCPVVTVRQHPEAMRIIEQTAKEKGCGLTVAELSDATNVIVDREGCAFQYPKARSRQYDLPLSGTFQVENAVCAIETLNVLKRRLSGCIYLLNDEVIRKGLEQARCPGRLERIGEYPDFVLDGAHNRGAALRLKETLDRVRRHEPSVYIFGVLKDKEYEEIIRIMFSKKDRIYTVTPQNDRGMDGAVLAEKIRAAGFHAQYCLDMDQAVEQAVESAGSTGCVLAFGSLSYLQDIRAAYRRFEEKNRDSR
jgi:dihydrofolate synthase/folylpolyglutamate synthase